MRTMKDIETKSTDVLLILGYCEGSSPMVIRTRTLVSLSSINSTIRSPNSFVMKIATAFSTEKGEEIGV